MLSLQVTLKPSSLADEKCSVVFIVTREEESCLINTSFLINPEDWDEENASVRVNKKSSCLPFLLSLRERIEATRLMIKYHCEEAIRKNLICSLQQAVASINPLNHDTLFSYIRFRMAELMQCRRFGTAATYLSTFKSVYAALNGIDIPLSSFDENFMSSYETYLIKRSVCLNTSSFYMRVLRAIYNKAVEDGRLKQAHPFRHVYTGIAKTMKRALSSSLIRRLRDLDLSAKPSLRYARDIFMLSFYLRGMSFIDMAYLQQRDLQNGRLVYCRQKTGRVLYIEWMDEMQTIVDRYPVCGTYLLPILRAKDGKDVREVYKNRALSINRRLKKISRLLNLPFPITLYVARHSWASIAYSEGLPFRVISEALGHSSENITRIYLASLETSTVDKANRKVIAAIKHL